MGTAKRAAGIVLFVVFLFALLSRPLLSNPAIVGVIQNGLSDWRTLALAVVLVAPTVLLVLTRVSSLRERSDGDRMETERTIPEGEWNADPRDRAGSERDADQHTMDANGTVADSDQRETESSEENDTTNADSSTSPSFLSGQGGARNREFEIEDEPPEASLGDHLEHLRTELDDPESREELDTLAEVVEETEAETEIPARCPQDNCDVAWSERGIIGARTGKYELLDENRVVCLACETVHELE